ncbi:MAG TPA: hypothetical protein VMY39_02580 [Planctomycetota bacterium]|nr:hypothetical protein [Planctomycetota bacterium]
MTDEGRRRRAPGHAQRPLGGRFALSFRSETAARLARPRALLLAAVAVAVLLGLTAGPASGDLLVTQSGSKFEGRVTEKGDTWVLVKSNGTKLAFPKDLVREVIFSQQFRAAFAAMLKSSDLRDEAQVTRLAEYASEKGLVEEREQMLIAALELRKAAAGADVDSWQDLAGWCKKHQLRQQEEECSAQASRLEFAAKLKDADLLDETRVASLAEFAQRCGLGAERETLLSSSLTLRRAAAKEDHGAWRRIAEWCAKYELKTQAEECEARANRLELAEKRARAGTNLQALIALAQWCEEKDMTPEAEEIKDAAIKVAPAKQTEILEALGYEYDAAKRKWVKGAYKVTACTLVKGLARSGVGEGDLTPAGGLVFLWVKLEAGRGAVPRTVDLTKVRVEAVGGRAVRTDEPMGIGFSDKPACVDFVLQPVGIGDGTAQQLVYGNTSGDAFSFTYSKDKRVESKLTIKKRPFVFTLVFTVPEGVTQFRLHGLGKGTIALNAK